VVEDFVLSCIEVRSSASILTIAALLTPRILTTFHDALSAGVDGLLQSGTQEDDDLSRIREAK
jgi:hypothetical protein